MARLFNMTQPYGVKAGDKHAALPRCVTAFDTAAIEIIPSTAAAATAATVATS